MLSPPPLQQGPSGCAVWAGSYVDTAGVSTASRNEQPEECNTTTSTTLLSDSTEKGPLAQNNQIQVIGIRPKNTIIYRNRIIIYSEQEI